MPDKMKTPLPKKQRGFTLIELVAVLVLVAVIAVYATNRYVGKAGFADYSAQDLIISAARIAQQRAMYDHSGTCFRLSISNNVVSAQSNAGGSYSNIGPVDWASGVALDSEVSVSNINIYFDGLGSAIGTTADCGGTEASTAIAINGASNLQVCLYSSGYIQAQEQGDAC